MRLADISNHVRSHQPHELTNRSEGVSAGTIKEGVIQDQIVAGMLDSCLHLALSPGQFLLSVTLETPCHSKLHLTPLNSKLRTQSLLDFFSDFSFP